MKTNTTLASVFRSRNTLNKSMALLLVLLCGAATGSFAYVTSVNHGKMTIADRNIKGRVTDKANKEGLPGVNVVVKGTSVGTTTDEKGNYSLDVAGNSSILVFSFVGYVSQEIEVGNRSNLDVAIESDTKALSEVVVIGYGTAKKSDLTGSVGSVKEDQLKERPAPSLNQALQGKISGVQVNINSGRPGGRGNVRIRGFSSINPTTRFMWWMV
jgi:TonB-dependent starch-binding outer membrane protein SusC